MGKKTYNVKAIKISGSTLPRVFLKGVHHFEVLEGLPAGTKFMSFNLDPYSNTLILVVEHESFEPIHEGDPLPYIEICIKDLGNEPSGG